MTFPTLVFSMLIAVLLGSLYHLLRGGSGWRLLLYLAVSAAGFLAGQGLGIWAGWHLILLGPIDLGLGGFGSLSFLTVAEWLSRIERKEESGV